VFTAQGSRPPGDDERALGRHDPTPEQTGIAALANSTALRTCAPSKAATGSSAA
jgi:hypothetical protein